MTFRRFTNLGRIVTVLAATVIVLSLASAAFSVGSFPAPDDSAADEPSATGPATEVQTGDKIGVQYALGTYPSTHGVCVYLEFSRVPVPDEPSAQGQTPSTAIGLVRGANEGCGWGVPSEVETGTFTSGAPLPPTRLIGVDIAQIGRGVHGTFVFGPVVANAHRVKVRLRDGRVFTTSTVSAKGSLRELFLIGFRRFTLIKGIVVKDELGNVLTTLTRDNSDLLRHQGVVGP